MSFLCLSCHTAKCEHLSRSYGRCEECTHEAVCVDCHEKQPKRKVPVKQLEVRPPTFTPGPLGKRRLARAIEAVNAVKQAEAKVLQGAPPTAKVSKMRRFVLDRDDDLTGTSGTGIVAEGVQFSNGSVVIHWLSQLEAVHVYANALVLETLHRHVGGTKVVWVDP